MPLPWFRVEVDAILRDAFEISAVAAGAHLRLCAHSWKWGPLAVAKLPGYAGVPVAKWPGVWAEIRDRWAESDGLVTCAVIEAEREHATGLVSSASDAGRASALARAKRAESLTAPSTAVERPLDWRSTDPQRTLNGPSTIEIEKKKETEREKEIQISESPPYPPQAGGTARAGESAFQLAAEPAPARRQAARTRKPRAAAERAPEAPPMPFRAAQAVAWVAEGAEGRFVAPDVLSEGHALAIERKIRERYGTERAWRDLGAAIGAGEVSWNKPGPIPIGVLVSQVGAWMPVARAWVDRGRTAIEPASARPAWDRPMCLPVMTRRERRPEDQAAVDALPPDAWEKQVEEEKGMFG